MENKKNVWFEVVLSSIFIIMWFVLPWFLLLFWFPLIIFFIYKKGLRFIGALFYTLGMIILWFATFAIFVDKNWTLAVIIPILVFSFLIYSFNKMFSWKKKEVKNSNVQL